MPKDKAREKVILNGKEVLQEEVINLKKKLEEEGSGTIIKEGSDFKTRLYS